MQEPIQLEAWGNTGLGAWKNDQIQLIIHALTAETAVKFGVVWGNDIVQEKKRGPMPSCINQSFY